MKEESTTEVIARLQRERDEALARLASPVVTKLEEIMKLARLGEFAEFVFVALNATNRNVSHVYWTSDHFEMTGAVHKAIRKIEAE